jgi:hypothetical protein
MADEFVQPEVVRLTLDGDRWIDVKRELSAGESRRVFARLVKTMQPGDQRVKTELDPEKVGLTKIVEYLVGWSFSNGDGKPVPISEAALNNLRPAVYKAITEAIDAHEERVDAEREAMKRTDPTTATGS